MCTGFSDANGSWKIIWTRAAYRAELPAAADRGATRRAAGCRRRCGDRAGRAAGPRWTCRSRTRRPARSPGRGASVRCTSSTACTASLVLAEEVAQRPADGEVLGQADRPQAPPRWPAPWRLGSTSCRVPSQGVGTAARPAPACGRCRGAASTDQEVAGLRCRTTSSALAWVGWPAPYGFGVVGPADPVLGAVAPCRRCPRRPGSSAPARRRSSAACSARRCGRRRRWRSAYAFSAAVASGLLKRPKLPPGEACADRLEQRRRP